MPAKSTATILPRSDQYWLFWDGECGFCRRAVDWARTRDRTDLLLPVPYQQAPDPPMHPKLSAACAHAVHILHPNGQIERAGRACLTVLQLIGCPSILVRFMRIPPLIWTLEIGYWLVARNRSLFSKIFFR